MKNAKYKVGDILYWYSVIEGKVVGGKVTKIIYGEYIINVDGNIWMVKEYKLSKRRNVGYREKNKN